MTARASAGTSGGRRVVRYVFEERLMHTLTALTFLYLLFTGLALFTPALFWLSTVLGGGFLSRLLHPWVGLVFSAAVAWMYAMWRADMRTTDADRAWRRAMVAYVENDDEHVPPAGRFNYGQKEFFWVMAWGALALLVTGIVLWFPQTFPLWLRQAAMLVHAIAALVTIGAFIVHIYMGIAVVPGSMHAILHGDVSEQWARSHHGLWAEEVTGSRRMTAGTAGVRSDAAGDVAAGR